MVVSKQTILQNQLNTGLLSKFHDHQHFPKDEGSMGPCPGSTGNDVLLGTASGGKQFKKMMYAKFEAMFG